MVNTTDKLKNVNLLTKAQYDGISNLASDELYAVETPTIVETYDDGNGNWYRIWSDGWIEQGGVYSVPGSKSGTFNLLKPYANTNYTVTCAIDSETEMISINATFKVGVSSSTALSYYNASNSNVFILHWQACGQGE